MLSSVRGTSDLRGLDLGMLFQLSAQIRHCQEHADRCRDIADRTSDPVIRADSLQMAESWRRLAQSFELSERASVSMAQRRQSD
jgi:hypothetical protein